MQGRPYAAMLDQICRSNGWIMGQDKGDIVLGVPQDGGAQQSVVVLEFTDATGQTGLRIWSPVAQVGKVPPDQALTINYQLPCGALAEKEGQIVVTATRLLNATNQSDLSYLVMNVAYYAHFYSKHYA